MNRIRIRNMKRAGLLTALAGILLVATACGTPSGNSPTSGFGNGGSGSGFRSGGASAPLNPEAKLALGTIKLEGSKEAVDPKMAGRPAATVATDVPVEVQQLDGAARGERGDGQNQLYDEAGAGDYDPEHVSEPGGYLRRIPATSTGQAGTHKVKDKPSAVEGKAHRRQGLQQAEAEVDATAGERRKSHVRVRRRASGGPGGGFGGGGFGGGAGGTNGSQNGSTLSAAEVLQARQDAEASLLINQLIRLLETKLKQ